jgi:hypothetical protein
MDAPSRNSISRSSDKARLDNLRFKGLHSRPRIFCEEVELIDLVIARTSEIAHEAAVRTFKQRKTPNIKRL